MRCFVTCASDRFYHFSQKNICGNLRPTILFKAVEYLTAYGDENRKLTCKTNKNMHLLQALLQ